MTDPSHLPALVCGFAFLLAVVFGAVAQRVSFCTMGAVTDIVNFGDWRRMRMWLLAIAVAIAGAGALSAAGLVDFSKTIYTGSKVSWLSLLFGGFLFGFGMTIASGCGSKTPDPHRRWQPEGRGRPRLRRSRRVHDIAGNFRGPARELASTSCASTLRRSAPRRRTCRRSPQRSVRAPRSRWRCRSSWPRSSPRSCSRAAIFARRTR
jgi:hypothetical protein